MLRIFAPSAALRRPLRPTLAINMPWSRYIENPYAISEFGVTPEDLASIELHELIVHRDGPVLRLRFDVPFVPEKIPARWPLEANATQITLAAWCIENLSIVGWSTSVRGVLSAGDDSGGHVLRFDGDNCSAQASYTALRVEKVSGYIKDVDG